MLDHLKGWASTLASLCLLLLLTSATSVAAAADEPRIYIVALTEPSIAARMVEQTPGMSWAERRSLLGEGFFSRFQAELERGQNEFLRETPLALGRSAGADPRPLKVIRRVSLLLNALIIRATPEQAHALESVKGVRGVYPNGTFGMAMDAIPGFLGAPAAWERLGGIDEAGKGIRIGIIDSGVDIDHPMFQDPSLPVSPPLPRPTEYPAFTNEKVIVARNYVRNDYELNEENTAEDLVGHGSIVASVAAGAPVQAPLGAVSGIAPRAYLGSYRVFGDPRISRTTNDAALIAALEDAVADGMDVINLSLGGQPRDPRVDPQQIMIAEAVELGVVVVIASGNGGASGAGSVMSPGTSPEAITVGSVSHPRVFGSPLDLASSRQLPEGLTRFLQVPGLRTPSDQRFGPLPLVTIQSLDASGRACGNLPAGSLQGKFALVRRGACFFADKAGHVLDQAGAAGMVVYNDVDGAPFAMDLGEAALSKPAVMIDLSHGETLRQFLLEASQAGDQVQAVIGSDQDVAPFPGEPDLLSSFSGRGPTGQLQIKPDLVAPGEVIYAASIASGGDRGPFTVPEATSGTSFSTPAVAGAAALVRQIHPDWTPVQIKAALVNTASRTVLFSGRPALPNDAGSGRVDLARAAAAEVLASPVSLAFGTLRDETGAERELTFEVTNLGATVKDLAIGLDTEPQNAILTWEPATLRLQAGQSGTVTVAARLGETPGNFEGFFTVRETGGGTDLAIPFFGVATVRGTGRTLLVSSSEEADFPTPTAALALALPGDVIELADDAPYSSPLLVSRNSAGVRLDGITIRAVEGDSPVIDVLDSDTLDQAVIQVSGVERVTIEGLTIRSRSLGISYQDASGTISGTRVLMEDAETDLPDAIRLSNSRVHLYGNLITGSNGDGVSMEGSEALVQGNSIGPSRRHGLLSVGDGGVALFDNLIQESQGDGIRAVQSSLLAKGNVISGGDRSQANGLRAEGADSRLFLEDNLIVGNAGSGLSLTGGAQAWLLGDEISLNSGVGLFLDSSTAHVESARFFSNSGGVEAFSADLVLNNSLLVDSQSAAGVKITESVLEIDHSTLANNAGAGIQTVSRQGGLMVANSIFHGNGGGDVDGADEGVFRFNLFDGMARSGEGNVSGQPEFVNPGGRDYTPGPGSAAIDRGDPTSIEGAADLFFHKRAVDGDGDGEARADIGAVEAGSLSAPSIVLPILSTAPTDFVGLAMVNAYTPASAVGGPSSGEPVIRLQAFDVFGHDQSGSFFTSISEGRQLALLLDQTLGPLAPGWVEIEPSQRDLMAFALLGGNGLSYLDGAQLTSKPSRRLLFPEFHGNDEDTWVYLVNPHDVVLPVSLRWTSRTGLVAEVILELNPFGMISETARDLFGGGNGGYLVAEAELPVFGLELFGDFRHRAGLLALDADEAATELFGAQLASTSEIETTIHVVNLGADTRVFLTARGENGAPLTTVSRRLGPGGELRSEARDLFGFNGDVVGWLEVRSEGPVSGSVSFGDPDGRFLASLPLQAKGAREFFLSHVAQTPEIFTGLTLLNAGQRSALVSLEVFTADGVPRATSLLELKPGVKTARLLPELLGASFTQAGGFVRVRSNQPVFGFELFGGRTLEYLSAVPPQIAVY